MPAMRWFAVLAVVGACSGDDGQPSIDAALPPVVYVVRHAETGSTASDPPLDAAGQARAQKLATLLADKRITLVMSSQYMRTQMTGMPTAAAAGLLVMVKDVTSANAATYGNELETVVTTTMPMATLIVGHSNTVPDTVKAFTGTTVTPIAETEFDRLYTITLAPTGAQLMEGTY
jgi:phosphohistidine phosphatase SixA